MTVSTPLPPASSSEVPHSGMTAPIVAASAAVPNWPNALAAAALLVFTVISMIQNLASAGHGENHAPALFSGMEAMLPLFALAVLLIRNWAHNWAKTMWYATLATYAIWLILATLGIWLPFFFGLVLAYICSPLIDMVERLVILVPLFKRFARVTAIVLFFLFVVSMIALFFTFIFATLRDNVTELAHKFEEEKMGGEVVNNIRSVFSTFHVSLTDEQLPLKPEELNSQFRNMGADIEKFVIAALGSGSAWRYTGGLVLAFVLVLVTAFFILLGLPQISEKIRSFFSEKHANSLADLMREMAKIMRQYLQGHTLVCAIVGFLFFLVLWFFGHPYAMLLGIVMGVLTFIPFLGPIMAGITAMIVTLASPPGHTGLSLIAVVVGYIVAQGSNDLWLYPTIAGRAVHLNPVVALLVLFVVEHWLGIIGMFFAVPMTAMVRATVVWMNKQELPGFEWLRIFRPYQVRHERTIMMSRVAEENAARSAYPTPPRSAVVSAGAASAAVARMADTTVVQAIRPETEKVKLPPDAAAAPGNAGAENGTVPPT